MELAEYQPPATTTRVPAQSVTDALADAGSTRPLIVHRSVSVAIARGSEKTKRLRLERLARVVMSTDARFTPEAVWGSDWSQLPSEAFDLLDHGIVTTWQAVSTRNAMRDSVRVIVREMTNAGMLTTDQERRRLNSLRPERLPVDEEKQSRGHIEPARIREVFHALAQDSSIRARRDAAIIALLGRAGLRRAEAIGLNMGDLDLGRDLLVVRGKGDKIRSVPLAVDVHRALRDWLAHRGDAPGPLITPVAPSRRPTQASITRLSTNTIASVVAERFGKDVAPHDLRRTFVGELLNRDGDLSTVSKIVGHTNPATTAGYDRRGHAARQRAVDKLEVLYETFEAEGEV
ncbi:tyrosine-type recombinase/integrase [Agrococcus sp. Ld7]|uniref:tyrosine-type recombinase/integrase n=1 Tax=Agrococcus sp. Ld7 TaxID=649148 RepID=UPI00386FE895